MGAYLTDHPPVRDQWYDERRRPLTGCTVLHTAESIMDTLGPDTGAEAVAEFIRTRTTAGSYHDLVDSDSWIPLVDLQHGAYHDATGSNNWATSLSFACRSSDWARMTPEKRRGFLRQGARAFANQQLYRQFIKAPLTRLRLITKAQSDAGESGFTYHGLRDPGRRSDPGVAAPHLFPFAEFIAECRAELTRVMPDHPDAASRPAPGPAAPPTTAPPEAAMLQNFPLTGRGQITLACPVGKASVVLSKAWFSAIGPGTVRTFEQTDTSGVRDWTWTLTAANGLAQRKVQALTDGSTRLVVQYDFPTGGTLALEGIPK